jgi:hypothetical protein
MNKLYEKQRKRIPVISFSLDSNTNIFSSLQFDIDENKFLMNCKGIHKLFLEELQNQIKLLKIGEKYKTSSRYTTVTKEQYDRIIKHDFDFIETSFSHEAVNNSYYEYGFMVDNIEVTIYYYVTCYIYETLEEYKIRKQEESELNKIKNKKLIEEKSTRDNINLTMLKNQICNLSEEQKTQLKDLL